MTSDASARVLLLTGAGRGFCAGQDLSDRAVAPGEGAVDLGDSIERNYKPLVLALRALPLPVVCAVNGVAAGAGANIALACDLVIAAKSASFLQAFCKIGLIPDSGGTYVGAHTVGADTVDGVETHVMTFFLDLPQTPVWFRLWSDTSGLVRRASMRAQGHFMDHRYTDFDVPDSIEPPG